MNAFKLNDDAIKFFKNSGLEKSREVIKMSSHALVDCGDGSYFHINQLKQIVDAFELVESLGGMAMAKDVFDIEIHEPHYNYDAEKVTRIEQAINLMDQFDA